jgi:hypothetical protein
VSEKRDAAVALRKLGESDLSWIAGLLEGEGCFTKTGDGRGRVVPRVQLRMTDEDVVRTVGSMLGSAVSYTMPRECGRQPTYKTQVSGGKALDLMRLLLPRMHSRRSKRISDLLREFSV